MAEWSIAAVLKTVELRGSGGSNPSLSATKKLDNATVFYSVAFLFCGVASVCKPTRPTKQKTPRVAWHYPTAERADFSLGGGGCEDNGVYSSPTATHKVSSRGLCPSNPSLSATKILAKATIRKDGRFYFVVARLNLFSKSTSKIKSSL